MRRWLIRPARIGVLAVLGALLFASAASAQQMQIMSPEMMGTQGELIRNLLPSVVNVTIRKETGRGNSGMNAAGAAPGSQRAFGSGFIIDPSGVIATNYHVVDDAWEITVTFYDGSRVPAHLLKATRLIDVALIKVDVDHPLPAVKWGDSDKVEVGDPVFAIGNALGVGVSVSSGIVSALNRDIMDSPYDDFIQTDAAINHGNSGGPLFDMKGQVIGIDTALISPTSGSSGVGFAIPSRSAQNVISRLMDYGWLRPGWIGVKIQQVTTEMSAALGMPRPEGSIVANVAADGPAAAAGLRTGDVILTVGTASPPDERALLRLVATAPIGQDVTLGLWRDGEKQTLNVAVKEWPRSQWDALDAPVTISKPHYNVPADLGVTLAELTESNRARYGIAQTQVGVLVTGVEAGTDAADRGLAPGDVILRVQERTVANAEDAQAGFEAARTAKRDFVLVLIQSKAHETKPGPEWVALRVADSG